MKSITFLIIFLWAGQAFSYEAGVCYSKDRYYKAIEFKLEQTTDINFALKFAKVHQGQMVKEQGEELYSVIYNDDVPAPATQYDCSHIESED